MVLARRIRGASRNVSLPESQLDRFLMKIEVVIRTPMRRRNLQRFTTETTAEAAAVLTPEDVSPSPKREPQVHINDKIVDYMIQSCTGPHHADIELGISPVEPWRCSDIAGAGAGGRPRYVLPMM